MGSAISTSTYMARAANIYNADGSTPIYNGGWTFKNASAVTTFAVDANGLVTASKAGVHTFGSNAAGRTYVAIDGTTGAGNSANVRFSVGGVVKGYVGCWHTNEGTGDNAASDLAIIATQDLYISSSGSTSGKCVSGAWTLGPSAGVAAGHIMYGVSNASGYTLKLYQGSGTGATKYFILINSLDGASQNYAAVTWNGSATVWGTTSDRRKKENITPCHENGIETVQKIQVSSFNIIGCEKSQKFGFIAQQLAPLVPNAVSVGDDSNEWLETSTVWNVDYGQVTPVLVKAIQELAGQVDQLRTANAELSTKLDEANAKIAALEAK